MSLKIVPFDFVFLVPERIAICPGCDARLFISCKAWRETEVKGEYTAEQLVFECKAEPSIKTEKEKWDEWIKTHYETPYVYQLPRNSKVHKWINKRYRFTLDN